MRALIVAVRAFLPLLLMLAALPAAEAMAQEDGDPVSIGTWRVVDSEALGEIRRLLVHLPRGYVWFCGVLRPCARSWTTSFATCSFDTSSIATISGIPRWPIVP